MAQQAREFDEKVIQVSRVSKKTKGGNNFGFSVVMVVGDRKGRVGVAKGKAPDVVSAIRKGVKKAKKKMIQVPIDGTTIPFRITFSQGAAEVLLKPAPRGTGVIAGGPVRAVMEAAGIRDVSSKIMGTDNKASNAYATFAALQRIADLVKIKGISLKSVTDVEKEEKEKEQELQEQAQKQAEDSTTSEQSKKPAAKSGANKKPAKKKPANKKSEKKSKNKSENQAKKK